MTILSRLLKRVLFLLFLVFSAYNSDAQDYYKIFDYQFEYAPESTYDNEPNNTLDLVENAVNFNLPFPRENGEAFITGLGYNNIRMAPKILDPVEPNDTVMDHHHAYYRFRAQLGYKFNLTEKTSLVLMAFGRLASDLIEVESDHFLYGGLVLFASERSEKFTIKYGLYANQEYYGVLMIPMIGVDWKMGRDWRMYGVLPRILTVEHTFNDRFRGGFMFEAPNRTYKVSTGRVVDANTGEPIDAYVQNFKNVVYAYGEVYLTGGLVFRARVGASLFRDVELYEMQDGLTIMSWGIDFGAQRTPIADVPEYRPFTDGIVGNLSVIYRFKL